MRERRILAIASGGGHWAELCRLMPAFEGLEVAFVSVSGSYAAQVEGRRFYTIQDLSRRDWWKAVRLLPQLVHIVLRERPDVVVTTGSAPALLALSVVKVLTRARTIWIDSIANVDRLSTSGSMARHVADVWLTQWPELERVSGPAYWGRVV